MSDPSSFHSTSEGETAAAATTTTTPAQPPPRSTTPPGGVTTRGPSASAAAPALSSTSTNTTTTHHHHVLKKRSRGEANASPHTLGVPDAVFQSALQQAAAVCSTAGLLGLAGLLTQSASSMTSSSSSSAAAAASSSSAAANSGASSSASSSANQANLIPRPEVVRAAAFKAYAEQPPWVHWSKTDMAASMKSLGPHRLGLQGALRGGYRMARASAGCSTGCWYYETWIRKGPSASEILAALPSNARLGPGLQKNLEAALQAEEELQKMERFGSSGATSSGGSANNATTASTATSRGDKQNDDMDISTNTTMTTSNNASGNKKRKVIEVPRVGGNLRIGWSMRTGDLQAPVGYDKWSYAIRDLGGIIHQSIRQDLWVGGEPFGAGDVMGCAICLDPEDPSRNHIRFFRNGDCLGEFVVIKGKRSGGEAFTNIVSGTYYPALSSYMGGQAVANFGPKFVHPPRKLPPGLKLSPVSELTPPPVDYETCLAELAPVLKQLKKAEHVTALQEAVQTETKVLMEVYDNYMKQHLEDIKKERMERGLTVTDFPPTGGDNNNE